MFILLGMPIVQIIIFGFALTNEVKNAKFAVLDQSQDAATREIIDELNASRYFDLAKSVKNYKDIEQLFRRSEVKLAVVFPPSFNSNLQHFNNTQVQLVADASDPNTATTLTGYATTIIKDYQQRLMHDKKLPYTINSTARMLYNPQLKGAYSFVPGVMAMVLMLVCTMMTAITIVREKETGTMEIMLVSPIQPLKIIVAKAVSLPVVVHYKYYQHFIVKCICARRADTGKFVTSVKRKYLIHHNLFVVWFTHFNSNRFCNKPPCSFH
ncbi:MAG: ABC transporter permease [Segetibacter sp.]